MRQAARRREVWERLIIECDNIEESFAEDRGLSEQEIALRQRAAREVKISLRCITARRAG